ncbi:hypothetical protein BH11PLA2_BH11PLA2_07100 [soil metagenome]
MLRVALYVNAFDPPTGHHRWVAEQLSAQFDRVVCVPCGPRSSRIPDSRAIHRATMSDLNFRGLANVTVDLDDLEYSRFTPPFDLAVKHRLEGEEIWHVVAIEWIRGGAKRESTIHREWSHGLELWNSAGFVVLRENHEPLDEADLPPKSIVLTHPPYLPSSTVRMLLTQGESVDGQLHPHVATYINRHGLFRDVPLSGTLTYRPEAPRLQLVVDDYNAKSKELARQLQLQVAPDPELIVSLGGDGTMLRAIRKHWRQRLPFFGINAGGLGFLLNGRELIDFGREDLLLYHLPLLLVSVEFADGSKTESVAFNDAWVERATGQTAWVRVLVNGVERVPRLVADGVLVSTAAGSSSYARAMGATPVPLNTDVLTLVGSNVLKPTFWRPVVLPLDSEIIIETVDAIRRPLTGSIDGVSYPEPVNRMTIRVSRTAAVELAFTPDHDPVAKLGFVQFPKESD